MTIPDQPEVPRVEYEWETNSKFARAVRWWFNRHPELRDKIDVWANPERCEWRTPLDGDQCALNKGHHGSCETHYNYGPPKFWYGINYPERRAL